MKEDGAVPEPFSEGATCWAPRLVQACDRSLRQPVLGRKLAAEGDCWREETIVACSDEDGPCDSREAIVAKDPHGSCSRFANDCSMPDDWTVDSTCPRASMPSCR